MIDFQKLLVKIAKILNKLHIPYIITGGYADLILSKLLWYQKSFSTRHLEDIESVLKISGDKLNKKYLDVLNKLYV